MGGWPSFSQYLNFRRNVPRARHETIFQNLSYSKHLWNKIFQSLSTQIRRPQSKSIKLIKSCRNSIKLNTSNIKFIIEKSRGGRFFWNRNWDLGWIWAGWHYWKIIILGRLWATFEAVFFMFCWAKIKTSALKSCIK